MARFLLVATVFKICDQTTKCIKQLQIGVLSMLKKQYQVFKCIRNTKDKLLHRIIYYHGLFIIFIK